MASSLHGPCDVPARGRNQKLVTSLDKAQIACTDRSIFLSGALGKMFFVLFSVCPDMDIQSKEEKNSTFDFLLQSWSWVLAAVYPHGNRSLLSLPFLTHPSQGQIIAGSHILAGRLGRSFLSLSYPPAGPTHVCRFSTPDSPNAFLLEFNGAQAFWREGSGLLNQWG